MADSRRGGILRWLAILLIRGRDAPFIRADIADALERDLARGVPAWRAHRRYAVNIVASAFSVWRARFRKPNVSISRLDIKLGLRMLRKQPGLTVVALLALAIGIPVGLAPMHAASALETPPPFVDGDRMQVVKYYNTATSRWAIPSVHDFTVWREESSTFEVLAATTRGGIHNVSTEDGRAAPVRGADVTPSTFEIVRVPALLGRTLTPGDEAIGAPPVVVISYALWQSRLAGTADVLGRTLRVDGVPREVVGVMPDGFHFPIGEQLWLPLRLAATTDDHSVLAATVFGRLAEGVSVADAEAELTIIGSRLAIEQPEIHGRLRTEVVPFTIGLFGFSKGGLKDEVGFYFFQLLALLVLTVACVNIGMLFLARTTTRSSEIAVRTALGASRGRVVSQLFTESLVLAVIAAAVGLIAGDVVANLAFGWLVAAVPNWIDLGVTPRTVLQALALAVFSAAIVGVIPALKVTGKAVQRNMQRAAANRSGVRFGGLSTALIVIDMALAVATLGVAIGTSEQLMETQNGMGIQADRYLSATVALSGVEPGADAADPAGLLARAGAAQEELVRRVLAEPDVQAVAVADILPGMDHQGARIEVDGDLAAEDFAGHQVRTARVDIDFFEALQQPVISGRGFDRADLREDGSAIIVNTSFVKNVLGGRNAIGQRIRYLPRPGEEPGPWYEIVGVVGHLGMFEISPDTDQGIYHPLAPGALAATARSTGAPIMRHPIRMAIRTDTDVEAFVPRLRAIAGDVDPAAIVAGAQRLDEVFSFNSYTLSWVRLGALAFVAIMIAMSASGTWALLSFTVSQRTREIGIRTALGEQRGSLVLTIARRALLQLGGGVVLGVLLLAVLLADMNSSFRRPVWELVLLAGSVGLGVMLVVSAMACLAPTLRALRIMPVDALRS